MDGAVVTGVFALGGVVLGGGLDWVRASLASKNDDASRCDELVAALDTACINLIVEARAWRTLDTSRSKLSQLGFGMLEAGLPDFPAEGSASLSAADFG